MTKKNLGRNSIPMQLQFFAEGGDGGGSGVDPQPMSFDDFLKTGGNQAEFDKRLNDAISQAVNQANQKWKIITDDKVSEAEKLAAMTQEEKTTYLMNKQQKDLAEREANITRRELMAEAKNTLAEKKLPVSLADVLDYTNADSCKKSISTLEKAFNAAVEDAVKEKLKGGEPPKKAPETQVTKEQYLKMGYSDRLKLKNENPELFKQLSGI